MPLTHNNKSEKSNDGTVDQQKPPSQNETPQNFQKNDMMNNDFRMGLALKGNGINFYDTNSLFKMNQNNFIPNLTTIQNVGFNPIDYSRMNNNFQFFGQPLFIMPSQDCLLIPVMKPQNNYFPVPQPIQGIFNGGFQACHNYNQTQQNFFGNLTKKQGEN